MKNGFSLIELMIVLSIISILSTFSLYNVHTLMDQRHLDNASRSLNSALMHAQANSRSSGFKTILCPSYNGTHCDSESDWSSGWITYNDLNENHTLETGEPIIAVKNNTDEKIAFNFKAPGKPQKIIFYRNGRLWPNSSFSICHRKQPLGKRIIMTQSGRIRTIDINNTDC